MILSKNIIYIFLIFSFFGFGQETLTVDEVLQNVQRTIENQNAYAVDMVYNLFPASSSEIIIENYNGQIIENKNNTFVEINKTIFLLSKPTKTYLKLNKIEKTVLVGKYFDNPQSQSPLDMLGLFVKSFENKTIELENSNYVCTLTTGVVTQLPYYKVELVIDRETLQLQKQILYLTMQNSYIGEDGNKKMGNPRLELTLSNFKEKLTKSEELKTQLSSYIDQSTSSFAPVGDYKSYTLIKN